MGEPTAEPTRAWATNPMAAIGSAPNGLRGRSVSTEPDRPGEADRRGVIQASIRALEPYDEDTLTAFILGAIETAESAVRARIAADIRAWPKDSTSTAYNEAMADALSVVLGEWVPAGGGVERPARWADPKVMSADIREALDDAWNHKGCSMHGERDTND